MTIREWLKVLLGRNKASALGQQSSHSSLQRIRSILLKTLLSPHCLLFQVKNLPEYFMSFKPQVCIQEHKGNTSCNLTVCPIHSSRFAKQLKSPSITQALLISFESISNWENNCNLMFLSLAPYIKEQKKGSPIVRITKR